MEEKIVLPAIAKWQGVKKAAIAERLRLDHGAIVSLLVPPPNPSIILTLRSIFAIHNPLEEQEGGVYQLFETLAGPSAGIADIQILTTLCPGFPSSQGRSIESRDSPEVVMARRDARPP
jgi:hypothetical protein